VVSTTSDSVAVAMTASSAGLGKGHGAKGSRGCARLPHSSPSNPLQCSWFNIFQEQHISLRSIVVLKAHLFLVSPRKQQRALVDDMS